MKRALLLIATAAALTGCGDRPQGRAEHRPGEGRYLGVGVYDADPLWQELAGVEQSGDPKAATLADDSEIIVVLDSVTGEVRQCGNRSGHCLAMNPWHGPAAPAPAALNKHATDLANGMVAESPPAKADAKPSR
jgi:hypothetical protein